MEKNQTLETTDLYYGYICPVIGAVGVVLNSLVFVIFSSSSFKEILYKYLKLQSLFIALDLLITSFRPVFYWKHTEVSYSYPAHLYEKYLITYGASVLEMSAFVCLILATLYYYLLIGNLLATQRFFLARVSYKYVTIVIFITSVFLFLYQLFEYRIVCDHLVINTNMTKYICDIVYEPFHYTTLHMVIEIVAFFIRDGLNLIILIVFNCLIFVRVKKGMNKKRSMINNRSNSGASSDYKSSTPRNGSRIIRNESQKRIRSISKTKYKLTIMVIMSSVNCAIGRLPIMVFFIIRNFNENETVLYFRKVAVMFVYLSYDFNFFFLYFTNKKFKLLFNRFFFTWMPCWLQLTINDRSVTIDA